MAHRADMPTPPAPDAESRKTPRHRPLRLVCSLGEIVDLSSLGIRVSCQGKCILLPGQMLDLAVQFPHGPVQIKGWIRWVKKTEFLRYEVGVQFVDVAPDIEALLQSTAWTEPIRRDRSA